MSEQEPSEKFEVINNYFDRIFVLTVERNTRRRELIEKELSGLDYEFFFGIDGRCLTDSEIVKEYDDKTARINCERSLHCNEIACAMSHKLLYRHMLDHNYKRMLILEDDVAFPPENAGFLPDIVKQLPEDWELLYLGYSPGTPIPFSVNLKLHTLYPLLNLAKIKKYDIDEITNRFTRKFSRNLRKASMHDLAHAYAINEVLAEKIVSLNTPIIFPADIALIEVCRNVHLRKFISIPEIFRQNQLPSSIWTLSEKVSGPC